VAAHYSWRSTLPGSAGATWASRTRSSLASSDSLTGPVYVASDLLPNVVKFPSSR
jgi:hypothetical protein